MLLRNLPCSSPRGCRSSPAIFGPFFSCNKKKKSGEKRQLCFLSRYQRWSVRERFYLQHPIALPFKQTAVAGMVEHLLKCACRYKRDQTWAVGNEYKPAGFVGQSVQSDGPLSTGTFEETFGGIVPPQVMILFHTTVCRLEVCVTALEGKIMGRVTAYFACFWPRRYIS